MKRTQKEWVVEKLREDGFVSRNACLKNYVSRLSAIIAVLEAEGFAFDAKFVDGERGRDYIYRVVSTPQKQVSKVEQINGVAVERRVSVPLF